jgi:mono/diheme cytochrome c family protein
MKTRPVCLLLTSLGSLALTTLASLALAAPASQTLVAGAIAQSTGTQSAAPAPAPASTPESASAGSAANGKRVYLADGCFYCHGTTGAGGGVAGPRLAPNPLPLEGVKAKVRTASGRMPVYSPAVLKDAEIADIVAYLKSIPQGKEAKDIPALNR